MTEIIWWAIGILALFGVYYIVEWVFDFWVTWPFEE